MTPIPLDRPVGITLAAQEWQVVLTAMTEAPMPWRATNPIIQKVVAQIEATQTTDETEPAPQQRANGEDVHAPH